ncbi:Cut9-interacting protein scn1 [Rhypophila decipiens]|uniref:Cut9-interacting protein scn1 n=1 Tax=Rhypophila decipiens TaxID=261697 RepID=A0AAN6YG56_9PEZI|nr:Cut9-interacting protein scn1 [Rhypophila decipiens]
MCPTSHQPTGNGTDDARPSSQSPSQAPFPWHVGVCDAHCHPTDTMSSIARIGGMKARAITIMATRAQDQDLVADVSNNLAISSRNDLRTEAEGPRRVVPAFGWHPWFSHQLFDGAESQLSSKAKHYGEVLTPAPDAEFIESLPEPRRLADFLAETRQRLERNPLAMVGEVGVDKAFRLPQNWDRAEQSAREAGITPGGREGRMLSPYHVKPQHQVNILKAQLRLAGETGRAASIHGVQAHGVLFEALESLWKGHEKEVISRRKKRLVAEGAEDFSSSDEGEDDDDDEGRRAAYRPKPFPPRICLHSFSAPVQMLRQYLHPAIPVEIFFSFSTCVNLGNAGLETKFAEVVKACPDDRLLVESDLHMAGDEMDCQLEQIARKVCAVKGWELEEGLRIIRNNYERFIFG